MPKGKKFGGKDFPKGNKFGQGKIFNGIVEARALNKKVLDDLLNKFIRMPTIELAAFVKDALSTEPGRGRAPAIETLIATILIKGIRDGDERRLNFIMERLIGKVVDRVQIDLPRPTIIRSFSSNDEIVLGSEITVSDDNQGSDEK